MVHINQILVHQDFYYKHLSILKAAGTVDIIFYLSLKNRRIYNKVDILYTIVMLQY